MNVGSRDISPLRQSNVPPLKALLIGTAQKELLARGGKIQPPNVDDQFLGPCDWTVASNQGFSFSTHSVYIFVPWIRRANHHF